MEEEPRKGRTPSSMVLLCNGCSSRLTKHWLHRRIFIRRLRRALHRSCGIGTEF